MSYKYFLYILLGLFIACSSSDDSGDTIQPNEETVVEEEMVIEEEEEVVEEEIIEEEIEEEMEEETSSTLMGDFMDGAHPTSGIASISEDGINLLLTNFKSDDGPLLELYIATSLNATEYVTLGELEGLEGDFSYELPENLDLSEYKYVMVWCVDFNVSFGHAVLE